MQHIFRQTEMFPVANNAAERMKKKKNRRKEHKMYRAALHHFLLHVLIILLIHFLTSYCFHGCCCCCTRISYFLDSNIFLIQLLVFVFCFRFVYVCVQQFLSLRLRERERERDLIYFFCVQRFRNINATSCHQDKSMQFIAMRLFICGGHCSCWSVSYLLCINFLFLMLV